MRTVGIGVVVGLVLAAAGTRAIRSLLFGVDPLDPATFGSIVLLLVVVAAAAVARPALAATRVDPASALRED